MQTKFLASSFSKDHSTPKPHGCLERVKNKCSQATINKVNDAKEKAYGFKSQLEKLQPAKKLKSLSARFSFSFCKDWKEIKNITFSKSMLKVLGVGLLVLAGGVAVSLLKSQESHALDPIPLLPFSPDIQAISSNCSFSHIESIHTQLPSFSIMNFPYSTMAPAGISPLIEERQGTEYDSSWTAKPPTTSLEQFIDSPKIPITDKILFNLAGDFFGKGTNLDGSSHYTALNYRANLLERQIAIERAYPQQESRVDAFQTPSLNLDEASHLLKKIKQAIEVIEKVTDPSEDVIENLQIFLSSTLSTLSEGETLLFPGGWSGNPSGHAIYYEFLKQPNGLYTWRLYNTGDGADHHSLVIEKYSQKVLFGEKVNIPLSNLLQRPVLEVFRELFNFPPNNEKWNATDVFSTLSEGIGGELSPHLYTQEDLYAMQEAGTCSFMSFHAFLNHQLNNPIVYQRFQFQTRLKAVSDYSKEHIDRLSTEESPRLLLANIVNKLARAGTKLHEQGFITPDELRSVEKQIQSIQHQLKRSEGLHLKEIASKASLLSFKPLGNPLGEWQELPGIVQPADTLSFRNQLKAYPLLSTINWKPAPETLLSDLQSFHKSIELARDARDHLSVVRNFKTILLRLPMNWILSDRDLTLSKEEKLKNVRSPFRLLSESDKMSLIKELSHLSMLAYDSLLRSRQSHPELRKMIDSSHILAQYKANAFAHHLLKISTFSDELDPHFFAPSLYGDFGFGGLFDDLYFRIYDPQLDLDAFQVKDYWDVHLRKASDGNPLQRFFHVGFNTGVIYSHYQLSEPISNWIQKPEIRAKLLKIYPEFDDLPGMAKQAFVLGDQFLYNKKLSVNVGKEIMPSYFYDMRDMMVVLSALEKLPLASDVILPEALVKFKFVVSGGALTSIGEHFDGVAIPEGFTESSLKEYDLKEINRDSQVNKKVHLLNSQRWLQSINLNAIYNTGDRTTIDRMSENEFMLIDPSKETTLNLQLFRSLKTLLSEDRILSSSTEQQIQDTLSYFIGNPGKLNDPDYQTFFQLLLFSPKEIRDELQRPEQQAAHFVDKFNSFVTQQFHFSRSIGDIPTATFFLSLNRMMESYVNNINPKLAPQQKLDNLAEIRTLLQQENLKISDRSFLYRELVLSHSVNEELSETMVKELLSGAMYSRFYPLPIEHIDPRKDLNIIETIGALDDKLEKYFQNNSPDSVLNEVVKTLFGEDQQRKWKSGEGFQTYITEDGSYFLDLPQLTLQQINTLGSSTLLPREVTALPLIEKFFGKHFNPLAKRVNLNTFQFNHEGSDYRIIIEKEEIVLQKSFPKEGVTTWYQYLKKESSFVHHWYSKELSEILTTDLKTGKSRYSIKSSTDQSREITHLLTPTGKESGSILAMNVKETSSPWHFLSHFEDPQFIELWKNEKSEQLERIGFLRFNDLSFRTTEIKGKKRAIWEQHPDYFLSDKQLVPSLKEMPHFLLLENDEGHQKVLLARQQIEKDSIIDPTSSLEPSKRVLDRQSKAIYVVPQSILEYRLDKKTGKLEPSNNEARYYLGMIHLWKHDYVRANAMIRLFDSIVAPIDKEAAEILGWISTLAENTHDHHPEAIAIELHAVYLLLKNAQYSGVEVHQSIRKNLETLYQHYLRQQGNILISPLKIDEELFLLSELSNEKKGVLTEAMIHRWVDLDPVNGRVQQARLAIEQAVKETKIISVKPYEVVEKLRKFSQIEPLISVLTTPSSREHTLLRPSIAPFFLDAYRLMRNEISDPQKAENVYRQLTLFSSKPESWRTELADAFKIMEKGATSEEWTLIKLLEAVGQNPDQFPASEIIEDRLLIWNRNYLPEVQEQEQWFVDHLLKVAHNYHEKLLDQKTSVIKSAISSEGIGDPRRKTSLPSSNSILQTIDLSHNYHFSLLTHPSRHSFFPLVNSSVLETIVHGITPEKNPLEISSPQPDTQSLISLFDRKTSESVVLKELKRIQNSFAEYEKTLDSTCPLVTVHNLDKLMQLSSETQATMDVARSNLKHQEMDLLKLANKPSLDHVAAGSRRLQEIGKSIPAIEIDELIQLFLRRDALLFHQRNPGLSPQEIIHLQDLVSAYLEQSTYTQHLDRFFNQITEIRNGYVADAPRHEMEELIKQFIAQSTVQRAYHVADHPEYLVLEHYMKILLRPDQVENLARLDIRQGIIGNPKDLGVVLEMIMGSGKSSVLLPLLGLMNADGKHLSIGIIPESLLPSVAPNLAQVVGTSFKQSVQVLNFARNTTFTEVKLQQILDQLTSMKNEKQMLLMTSSSVQSLFLKFLEHVFTSPEKTKEIALFREIFQVFRNQGRVIIDEIDLILDARQEHHFALGAPQQIDHQEILLVSEFYDLLANDVRLKKLAQFEFLTNEKTSGLTLKQYHKEVVPLLIDAILEKQLGNKNMLEGFFTKLSVGDLTKLKTYLALSPQIQELSSSQQASFDYVESLSDEMKNLMSLAREEIHSLIPLTAFKICDVNYGTISEKPFAIPFGGSDTPKRKAQFGSPYETWNYSLQTFLKKGIPHELLKKELVLMQQEAIQEMQHDPSKQLEETQAHQKFMALCGNDKRYRLFTSGQQLDQSVDHLLEKVNSDTGLKLHFANSYVAPTIVKHTHLLNTNPQLFGFLFKQLSGFTGTQWNADSFPERLQTILSETITGQTLSLLKQNSPPIVHVVPQLDPKYFVQELLGKYPQFQQMNALIDAGGMARGIDRAVIVQELLKIPSLSHWQGVVFYDQEDHLMIWERDAGKAIPLSVSQIPKDKRFSFYDQKHATGADIPQSSTAVAVVTISKQNILRDLLQAVWRLRGLDKSQRVEFVVDEEAKQSMIALLKVWTDVEDSKELTLENLFLYTAFNQAFQQGDNNYRALKHKIAAIFQSEEFGNALDLPVNTDDFIQLMQKSRDLFIKSTDQSAWQLYGGIKKMAPGAQVAKKLGHHFTGLSKLSRSTSSDTTVQSLIDNSLKSLPSQLVTFAGKGNNDLNMVYDQEVEVEVETQIEIENEVEKEQETEISLSGQRERVNLRFSEDLETTDIEMYRTATKEEIDKINYVVGFPCLFVYEPTMFTSPRTEIEKEPKLKKYQDVFDVDLLSSINLQPTYDSKGSHPPYVPFDYFQKSISRVLAVEDDQGVVKLVLLAKEDVDRVKRDIHSHRRYLDVKSLKFCLYDFNLGSTHYSNGMDWKALEANPKFLELLVQAKFFNGETFYQPREIPFLKKWIQKHGVQKMEELFLKITTWKQESKNALPMSHLKKLFVELQQLQSVSEMSKAEPPAEGFLKTIYQNVCRLFGY